MKCCHPHTAYEAVGVRSPETGKKIIVYSGKDMYKVGDPTTYRDYSVYKMKNDVYDYRYKQIELPCNNCIACRLNKALSWTTRNIHEAQMSKSSCFVTLTFGFEATVDNVFRLNQFKNLSRTKKFEQAYLRTKSLVKGDFSNFMKRLRKLVKSEYDIDGLRFYACGEYGDMNERPHYHFLLYNFDFPDKKYIASQNGCKYYTSEILEKAWGYGFVYISELNYNSVAYTSRYVTKKINGRLKQSWYGEKEPEYQVCSNRPGIGKKWFDQYYSDVYPSDFIVLYGKKQKDGSRKQLKVKPPRYYDNLYDKFSPDDFEEVKLVREAYYKSLPKKDEVVRIKELSVQEEALKLRLKRLVRVFEDRTIRGLICDSGLFLKKLNEYGVPYTLLNNAAKVQT